MRCVINPELHFENGKAIYVCDLSETKARDLYHVSICALASIDDFTVSITNGNITESCVVINALNGPNYTGDYNKISLMYFLI